jgi:tetrahydromethanopterin S-methyltransferase subunit C
MFCRALGWLRAAAFTVVSLILFALVSICFFVSLVIVLPWGIMYWQFAKSELEDEVYYSGEAIKGNKRDYIRLVRDNKD